MISIYSCSIREVGPRDINGASSFAIGERATLMCETTHPWVAAVVLQHLDLGSSVAVRHSGGVRSCMNKPSLWDDVLGYC